MKLTRHNGRARKTVLTIPSIMTAGLTLRTVSILMWTGQGRTFIGIVSTGLSSALTRKQNKENDYSL